MPVYTSDIDFGRAYQDTILREAELNRLPIKTSETEIGLHDRLLLFLGKGLINLGNKIMPTTETGCIELTPEQA